MMEDGTMSEGRCGATMVAAGGVGVALVTGVIGVAMLGPVNGLAASGGVLLLGGLLAFGRSPGLGVGLMTAGFASMGTAYALSAPGRRLLARAVVRVADWKPERLHAWAEKGGDWTERQVESAVTRAHALLGPGTTGVQGQETGEHQPPVTP
jgi:hypothetical protein